MTSFVDALAQGTIHHLGNEGFARFLGETMSQASVYIRHFKSFDTIMGNVGHEFHVVDIKLAIGFPVGIDFPEEFYLVLVEILLIFSTIQMLRKNSALRLPFLTTVSLIMLRWV